MNPTWQVAVCFQTSPRMETLSLNDTESVLRKKLALVTAEREGIRAELEELKAQISKTKLPQRRASLPSRKKYPERLLALAELLRRSPMTAKEIAERTGCSKPLVYRQLEVLRKQGIEVHEIDRKTPISGPTARVYMVR